ncbi:PWWP domain-containing protein 3 isoform X2 [Gastrolobium bilobum]|uniref:PWWP domain-containing protein 3 isoform X2 n=1 Tax=Gastrolobium bilobum TaxID=150636 RepID=UPI002AAF7699|nr:PWWP domain-containing protein 3 isoform X2 [Gastrolobium bilobum]
MGAKGKRRREKNYRAAHGDYSVLPPPPDPSQLDALPSKLRKIMSFTQHHNGASGLSQCMHKKKKNDDGHAQNDKGDVGTADVKQGDTSRQLKAPQHTDSGDEQLMQSSANDKKKKKRKRKEVKDLRFAMEVDKTSSQLKRRERKKKYFEAKKKKHKKAHEEEKLDFPGHEKIKFGDVVLAPPKLAFTPKAFKNAQDASQERLRLRAIEEYRNRKGWTSRPGSHHPPPLTTDP